MKRLAISVILVAAAGSAYASDFGRQLSVNAKDMKVMSAVNKDISAPSRKTSDQDQGPAFSCGSAGYPLWGFQMKNEPSEYVPAGYWAFYWPGPSAVKPVAPRKSAQHTGPNVPGSALNNALVYQTFDYAKSAITIIITPCPASGCPKDATNGVSGQTHEILVIFPNDVLFGTCSVQR